MFGVFLFLTYYLQLTLGYTPMQTGTAFLPMVVFIIITAQVQSNILVPRFGPKLAGARRHDGRRAGHALVHDPRRRAAATATWSSG